MAVEHSNGSEREARLGEIAFAYLQAVEQGQAVDTDELLARHPEFATELAEFLADRAEVELRAAPLREAVQGLRAQPPTATCGIPEHGRLGDFQVVREVGRGGMGVVYEAEQLSIGRRVALKVLPFAATLDARQLQRFKHEAQAAGHWQHTNIVPVYFVGCERGVHFYAMQYVDGQTLAALIADLRRHSAQTAKEPHAATGPYVPSSEPAAPATQPVAGLSTIHSHREPAFFRAVAQLAIQAAEALEHAHQMGVVHRDIKPGNLMVDGRGNLWVTDFGLAQFQTDASLTLTGDLVGTVRYMSPEQALAKRVLIDHRTDIYSLGVTLYELLTLRPAFAGKDRQELLRQITFEEPCRPRRLNRAIPPELETIVLKAMEKNPADRYATAQALADDLRRWQEDKPIQARRPSLVQRARKWGQRHRPVVRTAAVALLLTLAMLAGSVGWVVRDQAARRTETEREANAALEEAAERQREGRLPEALAAARRAAWVVDTGDAGAAFRQRVQARRADLELLADLEEARLQMTAVQENHFDYELADRLSVEAFQKAGLEVEAVGAAEAAERIRQSSVAAELAAALDSWVLIRKQIKGRSDAGWKHLLQVAGAADPGGWRDRVRDALGRGDQQALVELAKSNEAFRQPPLTLVFLGEALLSTKDCEPAEALLRKARQLHPADFWVNRDLAKALQEARPARWHEAIPFDTAAVALRPQSPGAHLSLGNDLSFEEGRLDEAVAEYREAIRLKKDFAAAHNNLAIALRRKGRPDEAIAAYREAIRLKKDYYEAHSYLGVTLATTGRLDEAITECREAVRLNNDYPDAHLSLGIALYKKGQLDEAIAEWQKTIRLRNDSPEAHSNLGNALRDKGRLDEAIAECREALRLKKDFPDAHSNLGNALRDKGRLDEAIAECREALRLKKDFPEAHFNLGNALLMNRRPDEAIAAYHEAIRLRNDNPEAHNNLGVALRDKGRLDEAIAEHREAIRLRKDCPGYHNNLGVALRNKGRLDEAIAAYQEAIRLKKDFAEAHHNLGNALAAKGWLDAAIAAYREAIRLRKDEPGFHNGLGTALGKQGRLDEAIAEYQEAIRLRNDNPEAHDNLGVALRDKGRLDEAIAEHREAIRLRKDYPGYHNNLGVALRKKGRLDEAIAAYHEAIRLKKDFAEAHNNLGNAVWDKGRLNEAIDEYEEAIRLRKDYAEAHCNLGLVLLQQAHFAEALAALKRGHELGSKNPSWRYPSAQWVRTAEQLVPLENKLPKLLTGEVQPADSAEQLVLAQFCQEHKKLYAAATRYYADAFAAEPKLADDLNAQHGYNAACAAALAACGQGQDAAQLDDQERARLRRQALTWLRADLAQYAAIVDKGPPQARAAVRKQLAHWQQDTDFAGVRGDALAQLPVAERPPWQKLWAEVEVLRERAAKAQDPASSSRPEAPESSGLKK
jgi:tetratricopeptide (TPR) repeat protein